MVEIVEHEGVTEWRFGTRLSRAFGYTASAFVTADGVLVDSGLPTARRAFERLLRARPILGALITHGHEDHAGNVAALAAQRIPVWIPQETLPALRAVAPTRAYRRLTWGTMPSLHAEPMPFVHAAYAPVATPGHSPDHHCVWHAESRTLFSGDLFLGVAVRVVHHDENIRASIASLDRAAALEPLRLFDAHRGLVPNGAAALRAKAEWTRELVATVESRIRRGDSDSAILTSVLMGESLVGWASAGEYARRNFVRLVRADLERDGTSAAAPR